MRNPKQKKIVYSTKLSQYIEKEIDFIKLDVEGAELEIINDLADSGKIQLVDQMVIEYHHHIQHDQDCFSKLLDVLEKSNFGYQIESINKRPFRSRKFQDILVYTYNKNN